MPRRLDIEELARQTGEETGWLRQCRESGLIGQVGEEDFSHEDVEVVRLIRAAFRRGVSLESILKTEKEQGLLRHSLSHVFPNGVPESLSLSAAAEEAGIDIDHMRTLLRAAGLDDQGGVLYADDIDMLRTFRHALEGGLAPEALNELLKVYSDALGRVAEAETKLVHFYVHARLQAEGIPADRLLEMTDAWIERIQPMTEPAILFFHRKGLARASRDDVVMHLMEAGAAADHAVPAQMIVAITFIDISSFTPLAAAMGDSVAAAIVQRFSELVREATARFEGRVVKQIGDAFMLIFPSAALAVACAIEVETRCCNESQFPAVRSGIHYGPVLYREGDYVGSNVNVAARVADAAVRHQILATSDARREAGQLPNVDFIRVGKQRLKGLPGDFEVFEARGAHSPMAKLLDPVCGMELSASEVAADLTFEGQRLYFCSEGCLKQFVLTPDAYVKPQ